MRKLKKVLLLNSISCILFGLLFLFFPSSTSSFIGNNIVWLIQVVGAILVINGLHLMYASKREKPVCPEVLYFILGDFLWVLGTIGLILGGLIITSTKGIIVSLIIAIMVATFGYMQVLGYQAECKSV